MLTSPSDNEPQERALAEHCFYAVFAAQLRRRGFSIDQAEACVLTSDLCFGFEIGDGAPTSVGSTKVWGVLLSPEKMARYLGIELRWHWEPDSQKAWRDTRRILDRGDQQVVAVDIFHIPYLPEHYRRHHFPHFLTISGFRGGAFEVADINFSGSLTLRLLERARAGAPLHLKNAWWELHKADQPWPPQRPLRAALAEAVSPAKRSGAVKPFTLARGGLPSDQILWGHEAAQAMTQTIADWAANLSDHKLRTAGSRIFYQITREIVSPRRLFLNVFAQTYPPGHTAQHRLHSELHKSTDRWSVIASLLLKAFLYTRPATLLIPRITSRLFELVELETQQFAALQDILSDNVRGDGCDRATIER